MEWYVSIENLDIVVQEILPYLSQGSVTAFNGPMGAGKTTLIHEICRQKKVRSVVSSPTYSIINEYDSPEGPIYHLDLFRLSGELEAIEAGVEEVLYSGSTCLIEWAERAPSLLPANARALEISVEQDGMRKITVQIP